MRSTEWSNNARQTVAAGSPITSDKCGYEDQHVYKSFRLNDKSFRLNAYTGKVAGVTYLPCGLCGTAVGWRTSLSCARLIDHG